MRNGNPAQRQDSIVTSPVPAVDVAIVCGMYKSGTSLLTALLEKCLFTEPSRLTNPRERGFGTRMTRYLTRECGLVRQINHDILRQARSADLICRDHLHLRTSTWLNVRDYLTMWHIPIVIKDPQFVFTLQVWLEAAKDTHKRAWVFFVWRRSRQLRRAWKSAPFTRDLMAQGIFGPMSSALAAQGALCQARGVLSSTLDFESISRLADVNPTRLIPALFAYPRPMDSIRGSATSPEEV
jgi:hypothetical protein